MQFKFNVRGDRISPGEEYLFIEGNKGSYEAVFDFDEEWDELAKLCIVRCGDVKYSRAIMGNSCLLPELVKNSAKIGVVGVDALDQELVTRISTNMIGIGVQSGAYDEEAAQEFSTAAGVWEQYLSEMEESRKAAEDAASEAKKSKDASAKAAENAKEAAENTNILNVDAIEGDEALVVTEKIDGGVKLHFTLPKGPPGEKGDKGDKGEKGPKGEDGQAPSMDEIYNALGIAALDAGMMSNAADISELKVQKADKAYVDEQILTKTVPIEVFSDVYFNRLPAVEANKADKSYVDEKVADKADKSYVDEQLKTKADDADYQNFKSATYGVIDIITHETIPLLDTRKADTSYVDEQVSGFTAELNAALQEIIDLEEELMTPDGNEVAY